MNTFNKKSLFVALASLGALSVTGTADAVYVNPDGTGQVLLYPYYTVRNKVAGVAAPFNTLLSVVNSTVSAKVVKVRFLEGKNSREVLDFNLYLSAQGRLDGGHHPGGGGHRVNRPERGPDHQRQLVHDAGCRPDRRHGRRRS